MMKPVLKDINKTKGVVLAVEDEPTSLAVLADLLEELNYDVIEAVNGIEALDIITREGQHIDVIILDKNMPEMDGLEVVAHLKKDTKSKHIPIIMVTGATRPEEVREGIDAGVFYYLAKPYEDEIFKSVLQAAYREAKQRKNLKTELYKHQRSFGFIDQADFTIRTIEDAENLACFLTNCFPNPDTTLPGLMSLLINAVEHGNLDIGYATKTYLIAKGKWRDEIEKRQESDQFSQRRVYVHLEENEDQILVQIKDEGKGFDWEQYLDIDPTRALDTHGRGIAQANKVSFDELHYNEKGNCVTAITKIDSGIKW